MTHLNGVICSIFSNKAWAPPTCLSIYKNDDCLNCVPSWIIKNQVYPLYRQLGSWNLVHRFRNKHCIKLSDKYITKFCVLTKLTITIGTTNSCNLSELLKENSRVYCWRLARLSTLKQSLGTFFPILSFSLIRYILLPTLKIKAIPFA